MTLVHGTAGDLVPSPFPPLRLQELQAVLGPRVRAITWRSPRPLSSAALLALDDGPAFVKRHDARVRSLPDLQVEHALAARLRSRGVPVPAVLDAVAADGWTYELHAVGEGEDAYRDVPSWEPHRSPEHAAATGAALARLVTAAEGFPAPARTGTPLLSSWQALGADDLRAGLDAFVAARPGVAQALAERPWERDLQEVLLPLHDRLRGHALPHGWTHGDGHPSNLLWDGDRVTAVLDLGLADRTTPLLDLAVAVERSCVSWLAPVPRARLDHVEALLDGWEGVRGDDLAPLPALLPLAHLEFALSELQHFSVVTGDPRDADAAYAYAVGHARWWGTQEGERLLSAVRRR